MSDPMRWLDADSGATEAERLLLQTAGDSRGPSRDETEALWSALAARLPIAEGANAGASATPTKTLGLIGTTVKTGAVVAVLVAAGLAAWNAPRRTSSPFTPHLRPTSRPTLIAETPALPGDTIDLSPPTVSSIPVSSIPVPSAPVSPAPRETAHAEPTADRALAPPPQATAIQAATDHEGVKEPEMTALTASSAEASGPGVLRPSSRLREESLSLATVRAALQSGDIAAARARMDDHVARFPQRRLEQERRALAIEILARGGDTMGARREARAFLSDYPQSPHADAVRALTGAP